ncbi:hypothetical protein [Leisingera caerulea]|uniref:hypothetical protein n=1 Tax=Leisingera caerulea TaxID=506591 RepID=UPI0021A87908|nr:hypothetical protein [Leisingera caerulea]UWQ86108.1 hypothetical protein K3726_21605 [Leisingera caerulea]
MNARAETGNEEGLRQVPAAQDGGGEVFPSAGLLEACRTKWQYGNWAELATLSEERMQADPDRGKVAILVAAAHSQCGDMPQARRFSRKALEWGCSREIAARVLISAATNSIACVADALGEEQAARAHFEETIGLVEPRADAVLLAQTLRIRQLALAGSLQQAAKLIDEQLREANRNQDNSQGCIVSLTGNIRALQAELRAMQRRSPKSVAGRNGESGRPRLPRDQVAPPFVIAAAGVPRSGSTWVYNAARLLCEKAGLRCYAEWCEDYQPDRHADYDVHLVKLHNMEEFSFPAHRVLSTRRDLVERLASLVRMGWLKEDPVSLQRAAESHSELAEYWAERTDNETLYSDIMERPEKAVKDIARAMDIPCPDKTATDISRQLARLPVPAETENQRGHDSQTLLHPNHRATVDQRDKYIAAVRAALSKAPG